MDGWMGGCNHAAGKKEQRGGRRMRRGEKKRKEEEGGCIVSECTEGRSGWLKWASALAWTE